jgi:DNA-binding transcriptional LysR family regulator
MAIAAALQGQGVVLADTAFVAPELKSGRLVRIGKSRAALGEYVLLEANDRSGAAGRAAFVRWLDGEILRTTPTGAAADV